MAHEIVLDIETQNTYQEVGAHDHRLLKISLVGVWSSKDDAYTSYLEDELPRLWPLLEHADRLIGYNINGFDLPVLGNYYPGELTQFLVLDLLESIERFLGFRVKLDHVAQATLGVGKSGHGLQAVEFWKTGAISQLKAYCLQDVKVTKELYEFGRDNGFVAYVDKLGRRQEIPVDFALKDTRGAVNLTIGL